MKNDAEKFEIASMCRVGDGKTRAGTAETKRLCCGDVGWQHGKRENELKLTKSQS